MLSVSMVKEILESMDLMMTKLSSSYPNFGGIMELIRAESSITSMQRLAFENGWKLKKN